MKKHFFSLLIAAGMFSLTACTVDDNPSGGIIVVPGIPSDVAAEPNPTLPDAPNTTVPNINYSVETQGGNHVIRLDLTGIQSPDDPTQWLRLYGTGTSEQNIWVSIDDVPKGFVIENTIDSEEQVSAVDLVFLVDNSGSMGEEANTIARDIISWSNDLSSTLDMRFGCIGYDEGYISGALDITDVNTLSTWLNKSTGTSRTHGFKSDYGTDLQTLANNYRVNNWHECGVAGLRMADENFTFRNKANRVYVNFTDEPSQPNNNTEFSTEWVKEPSNWPSVKGTIHTVFSGNKNFTEQIYWNEYPWLLSDYTGGTTIFTNASFTGVSLSSLPITGALQNSYIIKFTNIENLFDGQPHVVKITILSPNGTVRAEKEYKITFVL